MLNYASLRIFWRTLLVLVFASVAQLTVSTSLRAQARAAEQLAGTEPEIGAAKRELPEISHWIWSPFATAYFLSAGEVYTSLIYEDDVVHFRSPDHTFAQEIELGLPYRVNLAIENVVERYHGTSQDSTFSIQARYALADWDKIPLNPTILAEYKFGLGNILHDEGAPTPAKRFGPGGFDTSMEIPDAYGLRLVLSEEFFHRLEWALNTFFEQEIGGDRRREWGIAQSVVTPLLSSHEKLKVGINLEFRSFTDKTTRGTPYNSFVIGPTAAWRPTPKTRLEVSPLFGVNHKSPEVQFFVVFSYLLGPGGREGGEQPAPKRER
jgi:hypothetical protein